MLGRSHRCSLPRPCLHHLPQPPIPRSRTPNIGFRRSCATPRRCLLCRPAWLPWKTRYSGDHLSTFEARSRPRTRRLYSSPPIRMCRWHRRPRFRPWSILREEGETREWWTGRRETEWMQGRWATPHSIRGRARREARQRGGGQGGRRRRPHRRFRLAGPTHTSAARWKVQKSL